MVFAAQIFCILDDLLSAFSISYWEEYVKVPTMVIYMFLSSFNIVNVCFNSEIILLHAYIFDIVKYSILIIMKGPLYCSTNFFLKVYFVWHLYRHTRFCVFVKRGREVGWLQNVSFHIFFLKEFLYFYFLFIYLFIFGCVGSSFLCEGFL